jgi:hypothetical protein
MEEDTVRGQQSAQSDPVGSGGGSACPTLPSLMDYFVVSDKGSLQLSSSVAAANGIHSSAPADINGQGLHDLSSPLNSSDCLDDCAMSVD